MKHYKSPTNEVWAYEEDGSQDHLIPADFTYMTEEETSSFLAQQEAERMAFENSKINVEDLQAQLQLISAQLSALTQQ